MNSVLKKLMILFFIFCIEILITPKQSVAQAQSDIVSMQMSFKAHIKSSNPADTLYPTSDIIFLLTMGDTSKINKVHIKAGKTEGAGDFFNYSFKVKDSKNFPAGVLCKQK